MLENNEIYDSILIEFKLSNPILEGMKKSIEALTKARNDICKLLKIPKFTSEIIDSNEKLFFINIKINKSKIEGYQKKQIELNDNIKVSKHEIKIIKIHLNKLEGELALELQQSRKLNQDFRIFIKREKFKFIKKIIFKNYRKVFLKYSNGLYIKNKIMECNERKEKIRKKKRKFDNNQQRHNKKIIMDRIAIAEMRKSIIKMQNQISFFLIKIEKLEQYKEIESKFILEADYYRSCAKSPLL
ncbi:hypothetical protein K9O30_22320 [Clostridium bowmanii]|uniref:hypothetical protein n=1 Tax=Clostridium bowmanii TaxID=132925 RepID=UPI001C0B9CD5|nr:hypothetical protein [Clostridium bowmanii]MBU3192142.1 hypothetical protein [Clostridium bowmanii]MCA1076394.1 hypothetical protein [Clostridium bowmanii]